MCDTPTSTDLEIHRNPPRTHSTLVPANLSPLHPRILKHETNTAIAKRAPLPFSGASKPPRTPPPPRRDRRSKLRIRKRRRRQAVSASALPSAPKSRHSHANFEYRPRKQHEPCSLCFGQGAWRCENRGASVYVRTSICMRGGYL